MKITELEERMKGHAKITKSIISAPFDLKTEINKGTMQFLTKDTIPPRFPIQVVPATYSW